MGFCVCKDCSNDSNLFRCKNISFFSFPKDPILRKSWEVAIGRTEYPKTGKACSDHFTTDSFIQSGTLKIKYCTSSMPLPPTRCYLKHNAVPSIFPHKEKPAERSNTIIRIKTQERKEVYTFFIKSNIVSRPFKLDIHLKSVINI